MIANTLAPTVIGLGLCWAVGIFWYRFLKAKDQDFDEKRLAFIRKEFPKASRSDTKAYMKAWTTFGRRRVLCRLFERDLSGAAQNGRTLHS